MRAAGPKTLVGSSDITALHRAFAVELGVAPLLGPMPASAVIGDAGGPEPRTLEHLRAALTGAPRRSPATGCWRPAGRGRALRSAAATCRCWPRSAARRTSRRSRGGSCCWRTSARSRTGSTGCSPSCLQAGAFEGGRGIALGSWVDCGDPYPVLAERLAPLGVPVIAGLPVGHGPPQMSVWLGALGAIDTESCSLPGPSATPARAG